MDVDGWIESQKGDFRQTRSKFVGSGDSLRVIRVFVNGRHLFSSIGGGEK